jgi:hypothetical protein
MLPPYCLCLLQSSAAPMHAETAPTTKNKVESLTLFPTNGGGRHIVGAHLKLGWPAAPFPMGPGEFGKRLRVACNRPPLSGFRHVRLEHGPDHRRVTEPRVRNNARDAQEWYFRR